MRFSGSWAWLVAVAVSGCVHTRGQSLPANAQEVKFDEVLITGDLELEKLNDEELFAAGTSFYAAEDYAQAARYFGRICDFHPQSKHYRAALYNAGLALEKTKSWDDAWVRFSVLSEPAKGTGDALDAAFRVAECDYHLERYPTPSRCSRSSPIAPTWRPTSASRRACSKASASWSSTRKTRPRATLRSVLTYWNSLPDKDLVDDYFPGQAQFFLGEIFRLHYEAVELDGRKTTEKLAEDLEYKSELLLSSQGHYLRAIRIGNGYWATAAGNRIGGLYENMYDHMVHAPAPAELAAR